MAGTIDTDRTEAFAGTMLQVANAAMLGLTISVGHRTGLYATLAGLEPATAEDVAEAAALNPRGVREWLAAQVTGGIVDYDATTGTYVLPREHAVLLTDTAGPDNVGRMMTAIAPFAGLESDVVHALRTGGGIPVERMRDVQSFQGELTRPIHDASLLEGVLPAVPGLVDRLRSGLDVLDLGCGEGHAANLIADAFPASRVTGYDFSAPNIAAARAEASRLSLRNVGFEQRDAADLPPERFDLVLALDVIHDVADPDGTLRATHDGLRRGGVLLQAEHALSSRLDENIGHPLMPLLYAVSLFHCVPLSLAYDGAGLGLAWGETEIREALARAGFSGVVVPDVPTDPMNRYFIATKG